MSRNIQTLEWSTHREGIEKSFFVCECLSLSVKSNVFLLERRQDHRDRCSPKRRMYWRRDLKAEESFLRKRRDTTRERDEEKASPDQSLLNSANSASLRIPYKKTLSWVLLWRLLFLWDSSVSLKASQFLSSSLTFCVSVFNPRCTAV